FARIERSHRRYRCRVCIPETTSKGLRIHSWSVCSLGPYSVTRDLTPVRLRPPLAGLREDIMRKLFALAMVGLLATCGATPGGEATALASTQYVTVVTESGPVRGTSQSGENRFLGIPYAAPPVGALRWRPPQPQGKWQGLLDATRFGSICPQTF